MSFSNPTLTPHPDGVPSRSTGSGIPLSVKMAFTGYMIPHLYLGFAHSGWTTFLWVCNIGLILLYIGVVQESSLFATAALIGAVPANALWSADFISGSLLGITPFNITDWFLAGPVTPVMRLRASYHLWAPFVAIWAVYRLGFDARARTFALGSAAMVILLSAGAMAIPWFNLVDNVNMARTPVGVPAVVWLIALWTAYSSLTLAANAAFGRAFRFALRTTTGAPAATR